MFNANCKTQHFAGEYFIVVHEKEVVRRKECGTAMPSFGETRQTRKEFGAPETHIWWTGDTGICLV